MWWGPVSAMESYLCESASWHPLNSWSKHFPAWEGMNWTGWVCLGLGLAPVSTKISKLQHNGAFQPCWGHTVLLGVAFPSIQDPGGQDTSTMCVWQGWQEWGWREHHDWYHLWNWMGAGEGHWDSLCARICPWRLGVLMRSFLLLWSFASKEPKILRAHG